MGDHMASISVGFGYVQTYRHGENASSMYDLSNWEIDIHGSTMKYMHISGLVRDTIYEYECCYSMSAGQMSRNTSLVSNSPCLF